jgi:DNA adenine methylase Dam
MNEFIKSPLNYVGGKFKMLPSILPFFPKHPELFIDLFCGGCNVGINVDADKIIFNDVNTFLIDMLNFFKNNNTKYILSEIQNTISIYSLNKDNEEGYHKLRSDFNSNYDPVKLYVLICFSFNQRMRINTNYQYNTGFRRGLNGYNEVLKQKLLIFLNKLQEINCNFTSYNFESINIPYNAFVYCDPPYIISNANYCREGVKDWRWGVEKEVSLLLFLDNLNKQGINFALNNVLTHHGKSNDILIEWSKKYNVVPLEYNYGNFNSQSNKKHIKNTQEVLITNYSIGE